MLRDGVRLAGILVGMLVVAALGFTAAEDAQRRGRSALWGLGVVLLPPLWVPYLVLALTDRRTGRGGSGPLRWDAVVAARLVLAGSLVGAALLATRPVEVGRREAGGDGWSVEHAGWCGTPTEVFTAEVLPAVPPGPPDAALVWHEQRDACRQAAGLRLGGAWVLTTAGALVALVLTSSARRARSTARGRAEAMRA